MLADVDGPMTLVGVKELRRLSTQAAVQLGIPVTFIHVGTDLTPLEHGAFPAPYGLGRGGTTLVHPDGYIA